MNTIEKIWITVGGRKFLAFIIGISSVLAITNKAMNSIFNCPEALVELSTSCFNSILVIIGAYLGINVVQKIKQRYND